jgi:hypothetical protein
LAGEGRASSRGARTGESDSCRQAEELPNVGGLVNRTPLFTAQHSERYARQQLIRDYEEATGASLVVLLDAIFPPGLTYLEELIFHCRADQPLHVLLASPGGDGETAIRMVRSMQARCSELTVLVPDMAKSAATLLCLGADRIMMGPAGDLGPVDPQFSLGDLVSAKAIVAAVDEAERRVKESPETYTLFSGLLSDVNMLMVEQARNALDRTEALVREALGCCKTRSDADVKALTKALKAPLIDEPTSHTAVIAAQDARKFGLPAESFDPASPEWRRVWHLWTRYFTLGCYPAGGTAVYEGQRASHVIAQS